MKIDENTTPESYLEYCNNHKDEFVWFDVNDNNRPLNQPMPKYLFEAVNEQKKIQNQAEKILNSSSATIEAVISGDECSLTSLKHFTIVEQLISGYSREYVAKAHGISPHTVNRILYSPQARRTIATIINSANTRLANSLDVAMEICVNELMTLVTSSDKKTRLAAINTTIKMWSDLNKLGLANGAKVTKTQTTTDSDGVVNRVSVTAKVDGNVANTLAV